MKKDFINVTIIETGEKIEFCGTDVYKGKVLWVEPRQDNYNFTFDFISDQTDTRLNNLEYLF